MKSIRVFQSLHILSSSLSKLQPSKTLAYSAKLKACQKLVILKHNEKTKVLLVYKQTLILHSKSKERSNIFFKKRDGYKWTGLIWLRIGTGDGRF